MQAHQSAETLTVEQAYRAMQRFIEEHWERTKSDDFAAFLGGIELNHKGESLDPAATHEWRDCVRAVLAEDLQAAE